jgi:hypothetical protein
MYIITRKVSRPNLMLEFRDILHPSIDVKVRDHWVTNYKGSKCILVESSLSLNELDKTTTMIWDSKESWDEYLNDSVFINGLFEPIQTYRKNNNFTTEIDLINE